MATGLNVTLLISVCLAVGLRSWNCSQLGRQAEEALAALVDDDNRGLVLGVVVAHDLERDAVLPDARPDVVALAALVGHDLALAAGLVALEA
eukprot:6637341-Prymnesium_polylepis.1